MTEQPTPEQYNIEGLSHAESQSTIIGKIEAEIVHISSGREDNLFHRLDQAGRAQSAGVLRPSDPPKLIRYWQGREQELAQLQAWLADPNVVLAGIEGIGGTGKSSLAGRLYGREGMGYERRFWADLSSGGTFAELARRVLAAFGLPVPEQEPQLVAALVRGLQQVQALVVLDNLESVLNPTDRGWQDGLFEQFMRLWLEQGASSLLLVTTRERPALRGFNKWLSLGGLATAAGVKLLEASGIRGEAQELAEFVELVAGHPLTLRLVADLIVDKYEQDPSLQRLAALGLGNLRTILTSREVQGSHRQQMVGMAVVLNATVERLTPLQQRVFLGASVLRGAFELGAAGFMVQGEAIWEPFQKISLPIFEPYAAAVGLGDEPGEGWAKIRNDEWRGEIEGTLRELVRRSLLEEELRGNERWFRFQPVVAEYARWRCADLAAAHGLAAAYFAKKPKPEQPWRTLDDVQDFLELFHHRFELGDYDTAFAAVRACDNCLTLRGFYSTRVELYGQLVEVWAAQNSEEKWHYRAALTDLGNTHLALGNHQKSIVLHEQHLQIARSLSDHQGEATSLGNLGNIHYSLSNYKEAIASYQESLEITRNISDRRGEASSLGGLGLVYVSLGNYQKAITLYQQSLEIQKQVGDHVGEANSLSNLGSAYGYLGEYPKAITFYEESLEIKQQLGDRSGEASSLEGLGIIYSSLGEYEKAIDYYQQSLGITHEIGDRRGEASSLGSLGSMYVYIGEYGEAITLHQQSLETAREIGDRAREAASLGNLGDSYAHLGEYLKAIPLYQDAIAVASNIGYRRLEANFSGNLGAIYICLEDYQKALTLNKKHLDISQEIGNRHGEATALACLGNISVQLRQPLKAIEYQERALAVRQAIGDKHGQVKSLQVLASLYHKVGRIKASFTADQQARLIAQEINLPIKVWFYPQWMKNFAKFAQRSTVHLILFFILSLLAFPFALVWFLLLTLWRLARAPLRRR